jgi:hypothetical protein
MDKGKRIKRQIPPAIIPPMISQDKIKLDF